MRVLAKTFLLISWMLLCTIAAYPLQWVGARELKNRLTRNCFRGMLKIIGVRYKREGTLSDKRPLLLITNHTSYIDILILGAEMPVVFTPKSDIGKWPVIGSLCRLVGCVFIDRRVSKTAENLEALKQSLNEGNIVCLFPEGTTNDGKRVLPFRSSYFSLADLEWGDEPLTIQPAAIRYTHVHNIAIDTAQMPKIAWYGDMELVPHAGELLALGPIDATLTYLEPAAVGSHADRKELAQYCEDQISNCFESKLSQIDQ